MKKALRIICITTGVISAVCAIILGVIYLEKFIVQVQKAKTMIAGE